MYGLDTNEKDRFLTYYLSKKGHTADSFMCGAPAHELTPSYTIAWPQTTGTELPRSLQQRSPSTPMLGRPLPGLGGSCSPTPSPRLLASPAGLKAPITCSARRCHPSRFSRVRCASFSLLSPLLAALWPFPRSLSQTWCQGCEWTLSPSSPRAGPILHRRRRGARATPRCSRSQSLYGRGRGASETPGLPWLVTSSGPQR